MKRFLSILLFLCVASTCYGWSIGSSGYDSGVGPTMTLAGLDDGATTGANTYITGAYSCGTTYTAENTGTLNKGYLAIMTAKNNNIKLLVYDSGDDLIASSDVVNNWSAGIVEFTFSGANQVTITSGNTYRIAYISDAIEVNIPKINTGSLPYDSATYPTAEDPFTSEGNLNISTGYLCYIEGTT